MIEDINKSTIITIQNGYGIYSVSCDHSDVSLSEIIELAQRVLIAAGYDCDSVREYFDTDV
jgi:hypothetical protein